MGSSQGLSTWLLRVFACACLTLSLPPEGHAQAAGVLQVRVTLTGAAGRAASMRRHALLVSDTPPSRAPWRVVIGPDGTGRVTLPPGTYAVESEEPLVAQGRRYEWREVVEVDAGEETRLDLTSDNAAITTAGAASSATDAPAGTDPWDLLVTWEESVVPIWTPTTYASSVVVAANGLLATAHVAVGSASEVQAQLGPSLKVRARVVQADAARGVAILQVDPAALGARAPLPFGCADPTHATLARGQAVSAISTPMHRQPTTAPGLVSRLEPHGFMVTGDFPIDTTGGPVFASDGRVVGLTSRPHGYPQDPVGEYGAAGQQAVCELLGKAQATRPQPPDGSSLPQEPSGPISEAALAAAAKQRAGSLQPYVSASDGFDITFITPVVAYAGLQGSMDFGQWSGYVAERPPVLLVRVTPKQVERFWVKVARGAAMTQGVVLPPIKRFEPGFGRMRALCGAREVAPVQPFAIERRVSESTAIREGLYAFGPDALGPHCGTVTLEVYSEKAPGTPETTRLDAKLLQQLWEDLAPYRTPPSR